MSKNLSRKGLALGAVVALGSSLFAGAPAFAANELNLQPSLGTTYGSVIGETFTLNVNTNPGYASSEFVGTKLKYNVVNASKAGLTITAGGAANAGSVNAGAADNSNYVVTAQSPSTSAANSIAIATAATATSSVTVQAWVDSDFDSVIDSGEWSSAVQTITFNKASEVTWTTEFTKPEIGDTKFTAFVSAAPSINVAQLTNTSAGILFTNGSTGANTSRKALTSAANYDSTTGKLKFNDLLSGLTTVSTGVGSTVAAGRYSAQAYFKAGGSVAVTDLVGSEVAYAVAAATVSAIESATSADSDNVINDGGVNSTGSNPMTIRATATSVPMSVLVKDSTGAALKNTAVTVYVEENAAGGTDTNSTTAVGNYDSSSFTAGGKTLKDTTSSVTRESISFSVTTDADGKANFTITAAAQNGDALKVYAAAQGVNTSPSNFATLTWTTAVPASLKNNNVQGTSAVLKQAAGSTFTLNYTVIDQFGAAIPTADKYRVVLSDGTDSFYPAVSAGKASQAITLASTATGTKTYTSEVQLKGTDGNFDNLSSRIQGASLSVVVGTSTAAAKITTTGDITTANTQASLSTDSTNTIATSTRTSVLDLVAFAAGDKNAGTANAVAGTTTTGLLVAGTVADVTGANTYASVTLSGAGLNFIAYGTLYAAGSVTVQTDASGAFAGVRVLTTKAGKSTLTVTSGSASSSYVLDFGSAASNAGTAIVLTAPTSILPGKTLVITGKVTDKFGNGVTVVSDNVNRGFSVAYDGPGLVIGDLPSKTDASGEFGFRVLLGADEAGSATVTVSYDADGTTTTKAAITKTATVVIGKVTTSASAAIAGSTKRFFVSVDGNSSARNVVVKVAGKTFRTLKGATAKKTYVVAAPKGSHKVTVFVGGKLVATKTISVK